MFNLDGKVALVTGGARGIGRGIVLSLAKQGADVAINFVSHPERAQEVANQVTQMSRRSFVAQADVSKKSEVSQMVQAVTTNLGRVDILVNNAGIVVSKPFLEMTEEEWDQILDVNLKGQFLVSQAVAKEMVKNGGGKIINIASIASGGIGVGFSDIAHYCASKGGVIGLTEALAVELASKKINVNAIAPGLIETDMTRDIMNNPQAAQGMMMRIPWKRAGKPEDIGAAAAFLASQEADYLTGITIYVDGGWLAG